MGSDPVVVLFVHGIQGQPKQFRFLIDALPPEIEVRAPMLPGHGANAKAFRSAGRKEWLAAVRSETEDLLSSGKSVIYVGHSMGCLLGLMVSRELGDPYAGMLLLCCPFFPIASVKLKHVIRSLKPWGRLANPQAMAARAANSVPVRSLRDLLCLVRPYAELLGLIRQVRHMDPKGPAHIRFRFSAADRVVNKRSVPYAARWPGADIRVLTDCSHTYFTEQARRELQNELYGSLAGRNDEK